MNPLLGVCHGIDIPFTFGNFVEGWAAFVGADAAAHEAAARAEPRIAELLTGATVRQLRVVPGKIVNFVVA